MTNMIKTRLSAAGISSKALAKQVEVSEVPMSFILNRYELPTRETLERMCESLGCEPLDLYDASDLKVLGNVKPDAKKSSTQIGGRTVKDRAEGSTRLFFWINDQEKADLIKAVKAGGYRTITEWLREMMRNTIAKYRGNCA